MHPSFDETPTVTRADRRLALILVVALGALGCGDSAGHPSGSGSAGASQAGSSAGGTSNVGHGGTDAAGAAGAAVSGSGGTSSAAGGQRQWPEWVAQCRVLRNALCGDCTSPECLLCIYGTDEELQSTGVSCTADPRLYKEYCTCPSAGCPIFCRPEWQ
jgi:hypothetical protein